MPVETSPASIPSPSRRGFLIVVVCLFVILGILFHRDFESDQVLFANDGPLGAIRAQSDYALGNFQSFWLDLNWLGTASLGLVCDVSGLLMASLCVLSPEFGPVLFAKIFAPSGVFLLGLSAWFLFRQLRFRSWVCVLGGLAAALNTMAFSAACWGLPTWTLSWAMNMFAIAALVSPSIRSRTLRAVLAGCAVGLGVMEGFDVGAIFSMFTAAFAFLCAVTTEGLSARTLTRGFVVVAIMAVSAALIAAQTVSGLIATQVKGVAGMAQDETTKEQRWNEATQWSLPKVETFRFIIPGLFGYRMPELYGEPAQSVNGANYWGAVGQTEGVIQSRHSGMGFDAGVMVALVAAFGIAQSFRIKGNAFAPGERKQLWCWFALLIVALLLGWGRHAPFYRLAYALPYFSTIRNPFKFLFPFSLALLILFGYGLEGLSRLYFDKAVAKGKDWRERIRAWWKTAPAFDKKWTIGTVVSVVAGLLGLLIYAASKRELVDYLQRAGFPDQQFAESIARFSLHEGMLFLLLLILSGALLTLILSGVFAGTRARWAVFLIGALVVMDLARADTQWIVYYNYKDKYATNPIIEKLREKPHEYRVTAELMPLSRGFLLPGYAGQLYYAEWLQHHFQYYRIQSLDIIQLPREPEFDRAYMSAFQPNPATIRTLFHVLDPRVAPMTNDGTASRCARLWQLTNTRYLLGSTNLLGEMFNPLIDPEQRWFRIVSRFNLAPKPGVTSLTRLEQFTAVADSNGPIALFEFTGALPRARLFSQWQVSGNNQETLERLVRADFDPAQTVIVTGELPNPPTPAASNAPPGNVRIDYYAPKLVRLNAEVAAPSVLLLNDRHDPYWNVTIDGRPEPLLRCNYIMRGVYLMPGKHRVEFRFRPPLTAFYISLTGLAAGVLLCGYVVVRRDSANNPGSSGDAVRPSAKNVNRRS